MLRRFSSWLCCAALTASAVGCFAYDSRWAQRAAENKRAKERLRPPSLALRRSTTGSRRVGHVRAYATRAYAAETLNWEAQFEKLLSDANQVLEPGLDFKLENAGTDTWDPAHGEAPSSAIADLAQLDDGTGAHWVVGFLQSTPKLVTDFHLLGMGRYFSKYLVVRSSADPRESEHLARFEGLDDGEREKLYSQRRHHKIVAVFLHEIGHTLGAVHRTARDSLMSPLYDPQEQGFDEATFGLMRLTLPAHLEQSRPATAFPALVAYLERNTVGWVGSEREQMLSRLKPVTPPRAATATATATAITPAPAAPSRPSTPLPLSGLSPSDRAIYDRARSLEQKSDPNGAWDAAESLFELHPRVIEIQDLRCRLAKAKHWFSVVVDAHCQRFSALTGAVPEAAP